VKSFIAAAWKQDFGTNTLAYFALLSVAKKNGYWLQVEDLEVVGEGNWTGGDTWFDGRKKAFEVWLRLTVWPKAALNPGNTFRSGRFCTVDLLVLINVDQLLFILKEIFFFYKTSYLDGEVNGTEPSHSVSVPW
jgi:hypothetical protein